VNAIVVNESTVSLKGQGQVANATFPVYLPAGASIRSSSTTFETPESPLEAPTNVTFEPPGSGTPLWQWGGQFGESAVQTQFSVSNSSGSTVITLPNASLTGGSANLRSIHGTLSGTYSLSLAVGLDTLFARNGSKPFLPFGPLSWATDNTPSVHNKNTTITAISAAPDGPSSEILATGDNYGFLSIYSLAPGGTGGTVLNQALVSNTTVSAIVQRDVYGNGFPTTIATCAQNIYLAGQGISGQWGAPSILSLHDPGGGPDPTAVAASGMYMSGVPTVVAIGSDKDMFYSTYTSTGWNNPLTLLTHLPSTATSMSTEMLANQTAEIAVGSGNNVQLYLMNLSSPLLLYQNMSLPTGVYAAQLNLNSTGQGLLVLGSDHLVYRASAPEWTLAQIPMAGEGWTGSWLGDFGGTDIGVVAANGTVDLLNSPFGATTSLVNVTQAGAGYSPIGAVQLASVYGVGEPDVMISTGRSVLAAQYAPTFNQTVLGAWNTVVQEMVESGIAQQWKSLVDGNVVYNVPIYLAVHEGGAILYGAYSTWNYSLTVNTTSYMHSVVPSGLVNPSKTYVTFAFQSQTPGQIHFITSLTYSVPTPPTPPTPANKFTAFFSAYWLWIVLVLAAAGAVFFALGNLGYFAHHRSGGSQVRARSSRSSKDDK
jgi:hypothetical protein